MRVLIAPDKFKGTLTAQEAAAAICVGLANESVESRVCPIADGGEGTAALLANALGGQPHSAMVRGPLGTSVNAAYFIVPERQLALLEMSAASGLALLTDGARSPWTASTYGTGELLAAANQPGVNNMVLGIGGSATNDGGVGMARALGVRFLDAQGVEIIDLPERMLEIRHIDAGRRLTLPDIEAACDVDNLLLGPRGATASFGPQKGIVARQLQPQEQRLSHLAKRVATDLGKDVAETPGAGAAGGLGFGLMSFCNATLTSGFTLVADLIDLQQQVSWADVVITGEGKMDAQTLMGKGPVGVARMAHAAGKRIVGVCGAVEGREQLLDQFDEVVAVVDERTSTAQALAAPGLMLQAAVARSSAKLLLGS